MECSCHLYQAHMTGTLFTHQTTSIQADWVGHKLAQICELVRAEMFWVINLKLIT